MRRLIGPTGSPQIVPRFNAGTPVPLIDLTGEEVQADLQNRTVFVDLWVYCATEDSAGPSSLLGGGVPSFISSMVGVSAIQENATLRVLKSWLFAAPTNDLVAAGSDPDRRIIGELTGLGARTQTEVNQLVASDDILSPGFPCHALRRFPISGPFALWYLHNYTDATAQMFVWGYYTIEGADEAQERRHFLRRPLQPSTQTVQTEYLSVRAEPDNVPVVVHQTTDNYVDEVTIDTRLVTMDYGGSGISGLGVPYRSFLEFENPGGVAVSMPIWDKGDFPSGTNGDQQTGSAIRRWLDGIPMRGAGQISARRIDAGAPDNTYATSVRGSFVRY